MIETFNYYIEKNLVRKVPVNPNVIKSLLKRSEIRLKLASNQPSKEEAPIVFEQVYESMREATQALLQKHGFKPFSHEALVAFMIENNFDPSIINIFNKYRILRNKSVYEAAEISVDKCKEAKSFAEKFIPKIKEKIK